MLTSPTAVPQVALYLCKELPLSFWQPRTEEICVIGAWLLQHPLSAVENRLACVILEGLNWGYTQVMPVALKKKNPERICESVAHLISSSSAGRLPGAVFLYPRRSGSAHSRSLSEVPD